MKMSLIAALLASAIAAPVSAAELVVNGGFESPNGLNNGWDYTVSDTLAILTSPAAHSGNAWLRFTSSADYAQDYVEQSLATVVGQSYHYSFFLAAATTDYSAPSQFVATIGGMIVADFADTGTFDYFETSGDFIATSNATEIHFEAFNSLGLYLLDDVSVTGPLASDCIVRAGCGAGAEGGAAPEPAAWALMLLGFGGVGAHLRRLRARIMFAA